MNEYPNAYFRLSDTFADKFGDFDIPESWWSRSREYPWAIQYAVNYHAYDFDSLQKRFTVMDAGCGWHYRPFHDALCTVCEFVYGVDFHEEVVQLPPMDNGIFVVADFSKPIKDIQPQSLDRIFCISVLEELINYQDALAEFKRLLKDNGRIVLTCDMPYNPAKPAHELYKGIELNDLENAIQAAGLQYDGSINRTKPEDILFNTDFNLCVWHCVLKKSDHA